VRRRFRHSAAAAGWAEAAALARERNQTVVATIVTMDSEETVRKDAAAKK